MANSTVTTINDATQAAIIIAGLLVELRQHTGEGYEDGLKRLYPNLDAADAEYLANKALIEQERRENAALPDA